ncbi:XS domain [Dillenia turbinata]|uniref:XS domain n=1 Tax=Dillenia turbinata TaxID=194707 RepID=A0AAN8VHN4_9MAGN
MAGGSHPKASSHKPSSSSSSSHRKSRWESTATSSDSKPPPLQPPKPSSNPNPQSASQSAPSPNSKPPTKPSQHTASGPSPGSIGPSSYPDGPPPPPAYGFHMLERRTIVLADGSVRTYFALPPDYQDFPQGPNPMNYGGRMFPHGGFENRMPPMMNSEGFRDREDPYRQGKNQDYWNSLGLDGRGPVPVPAYLEGSLKRKFGGVDENKDEFDRHRQQNMQMGNASSNLNNNPSRYSLGGVSSPFRREDEVRSSKYMRIGGGTFENYSGVENVRAKHLDVDPVALEKAFLYFVKVVNETESSRRMYLEDGKQGSLHCVACDRFDYVELVVFCCFCLKLFDFDLHEINGVCVSQAVCFLVLAVYRFGKVYSAELLSGLLSPQIMEDMKGFSNVIGGLAIFFCCNFELGLAHMMFLKYGFVLHFSLLWKCFLSPTVVSKDENKVVLCPEVFFGDLKEYKGTNLFLHLLSTSAFRSILGVLCLLSLYMSLTHEEYTVIKSILWSALAYCIGYLGYKLVVKVACGTLAMFAFCVTLFCLVKLVPSTMVVSSILSSKGFPDMHALVMHAYYSDTAESRVDHLGLHKALCVLMGWNYSKPPDATKVYQFLSADEAAANQEDLVIWPPIVIIHNTNTGKGKDGRMEGLGNRLMDSKLRGTYSRIGFLPLMQLGGYSSLSLPDYCPMNLCGGYLASDSLLLVVHFLSSFSLENSLKSLFQDSFKSDLQLPFQNFGVPHAGGLLNLGFSAGKPKSVYGRDGHLGITIVKFPNDQSGLREAVRLAEYFEKENRGRRAWFHVQPLVSSKDDEKNPLLVKLDEKTGEKNRVLYGYLGTAADLDKVDFDTRKRAVIESRREYKSMKFDRDSRWIWRRCKMEVVVASHRENTASRALIRGCGDGIFVVLKDNVRSLLLYYTYYLKDRKLDR